MQFSVCSTKTRWASEKNIIESTNPDKYATIVAIMGKTIRKYQIRDRKNQYKRIEKQKMLDKYYTDVSKSHERDVRRNSLPDEQPPG